MPLKGKWQRNVPEVHLETLTLAWDEWERQNQPLAVPQWTGHGGDSWQDGKFESGPNKGKKKYGRASFGVVWLIGGADPRKAHLLVRRPSDRSEWHQESARSSNESAAVGAHPPAGNSDQSAAVGAQHPAPIIKEMEERLIQHPFVCAGSIERDGNKLIGIGALADHQSHFNLKCRTTRNFSIVLGLTKQGEVLDEESHAWVEFCGNTKGQFEKKKAAIDLLLNITGYKSLFRQYQTLAPDQVWNPCKKVSLACENRGSLWNELINKSITR
jgi:hypothetical protein